MSDAIITCEGLGKSYLIGHTGRRESYTALRDVIANQARHLWQRTRRAMRGQTSVEGREIEEFWALKDVSFEVKQGEVLGIIGRNGAGKSTLLKVLSRITEPTEGRVTLRGRVASLLEVGTGFHPELTGRENIFLNGAILGMARAEIKRKFDEIVAFAEVEKFLDTPVKRYSSGMYVRLAFAVAAHLEPEILVVDEVLAVGDAEFQKKCLGKMQDVSRGGRTVLFVSHNMAAISSLCQNVILLKEGVNFADGPTQIVLQNYVGLCTTSEFYPNDGILKRLTATADDSSIQISADFHSLRELSSSNLGFVVSDIFGAPIFGTNQMMSDSNAKRTAGQLGSITAIISQPRLLNGDYQVSVWFDDGNSINLQYLHCLRFTVVGQAGIRQRSATSLGPVWPACVWQTNHADNPTECAIRQDIGDGNRANYPK